MSIFLCGTLVAQAVEVPHAKIVEGAKQAITEVGTRAAQENGEQSALGSYLRWFIPRAAIVVGGVAGSIWVTRKVLKWASPKDLQESEARNAAHVDDKLTQAGKAVGASVDKASQSLTEATGNARAAHASLDASLQPLQEYVGTMRTTLSRVAGLFGTSSAQAATSVEQLRAFHRNNDRLALLQRLQGFVGILETSARAFDADLAEAEQLVAAGDQIVARLEAQDRSINALVTGVVAPAPNNAAHALAFAALGRLQCLIPAKQLEQ